MLQKRIHPLVGMLILVGLLVSLLSACASNTVVPAPAAAPTPVVPGATATSSPAPITPEPSASTAQVPGASPSPTTGLASAATSIPTETAAPAVSPLPTTTLVPAATSNPIRTVTPSGAQVPAPATAAAGTATPVTPAAGPQAAPVFAGIQHDYTRPFMGVVRHNRLGAPVEAAHDTKVARQSFGFFTPPGICHSKDSLMLWREDQRLIYVLLVENGGLHWDQCPDYWQVFADTWQPGDPNNEDIAAPEGKIVPRGGFGKVWRENFYAKEGQALGFPSAPESYTTATVQRFEHGTAFHFADDGMTFVLFDDFHYITRGGETTGRIWFKD